MAAAVKYLDTAKMAWGRATTGVAATDGSGTSTAFTWYNTAPASDWMLTKIIFSSSSATGVGNPAACILHIYVTDATTERRIRTINLGDPAVGSVTVPEWQIEVNFGPEFILPSTMLPRFSVSVTPTAGNIDAVLFAQVA